MKTQIDTALPDHARIWIYQAEHKLLPQHTTIVKERAAAFVSDWTAHGASLCAGFVLLHDLFLVMIVDEQQAAASGCSIDKSTRLIKDLEEELSIRLTNRLTVAYVFDEQIHLMPLAEFETELETGNLPPDILFFDNTIVTLGQLRNEWVKPVNESWMKRFLPKKSII